MSDVHDQIEELVLYISEADTGDVPRDVFDGCYPFTDEWVSIKEHGTRERAIPLFIPLSNGFSVSTIGTPIEEDTEDNGKLLFHRIRMLPDVLKPSWVRRRYRYGLGEDFSLVDDAGKSTCSLRKHVIGSNDGMNWYMRNGERHDRDMGAPRAHIEPEYGHNVKLYLGIWWRMQRSWRVLIGFGEGPRISLETGPEGAREIFRLRDIPPGRLRRAALRHWVRAHYRNGEGDPIAVRKHLRGATDFTWNGLNGFVFVPPERLESELTSAIADIRAGKIAVDGVAMPSA